MLLTNPPAEAWIQSLDGRHPLELVFANAGVSADTSGLPETADRAQRILISIFRVLLTRSSPFCPTWWNGEPARSP